MKRSRLSPGAKSLQRGSTFESRGNGPTRTSRARSTFTPASRPQRAKVRFAACVVCASTPVDPAHLTPRSYGGCSESDCVIALCRLCHRAFDDGRLDLLPYLAGQGFRAELAHMQSHYDDPLSVLYRLSGMRWRPESEGAA
jgi:hypothetical protein